MKSILGTIGLASMLALCGPVRAEEEVSAADIQARLGYPQVREFVPCGGQDPRDQARCVRWQYDRGALHVSYYFDVRTQRLLEVSAWDEGTGQASSEAKDERYVEAEARVAATP